jgi:hypothetical protein
MSYGNNPVTGTQGALPTNQFPASSVYPPNIGGSNPAHDFKASGGGPIRTDDDGNQYSEPLVYVKDGDNETQGAKADTAATSGTGSWSAIALLKGILTKLLGTIAVTGTFWQATQPVSGSVSVSNFPATQPVSGAVTTSGTVTEANSAAIKTDLDTVVTNTTGLATQTTLAAAKTDLDSIVTNTQTPLTSATATRSNVAAAVSDTSLLASNAARKGAIFYNDSTAILYLAYGAGAASVTSYSVQIPANGYFELPPQPIYTGAIRGIWATANGNCRITELS